MASRFRQLRGDDFTGGFVLRRYESFVGAEVPATGRAAPPRTR
ncbi:hypothetical protein AB0M36_12370 [Actinoplanes sp. NPDC051346]